MPKYTDIVLLELSKWENPNKPGTGFILEVVHTITEDRKSKGVGVQKVYFYQDGEKKIGKPLQRKDFTTVKERWGEILSLMESPPPVPEAPAEDHSIEEVPF